jgi:hypothetical protein
MVFENSAREINLLGIHSATADGLKYLYVFCHEFLRPLHMFVNTSRTSCTPYCKMYEVL